MKNHPFSAAGGAQVLQFLKVFADEVHMADNVVKNPLSHLVPRSITEQNVLQHYVNIFEPGYGKPLGNHLHIEMDPTVTPVHAPRRRIPVSKLDHDMYRSQPNDKQSDPQTRVHHSDDRRKGPSLEECQSVHHCRCLGSSPDD